MTTTVADLGWTHNAATMMADQAFGIPLALGLGLLMAAVVFCMERVLVVSIRQDASLGHKPAAFAWRVLIASLAAALVTTPFALACFNNGTLARLDDERLALMSAKRQTVEGVSALRDRAGAITAIDRDLAANRAQRDPLPADVQSLSDAAAACERDHTFLQHSMGAKIAAANRRYAAAIGREIAGWRQVLAVKAQACRDLAEQSAIAKQECFSRLDRQWQQETARDSCRFRDFSFFLIRFGRPWEPLLPRPCASTGRQRIAAAIPALRPR